MSDLQAYLADKAIPFELNVDLRKKTWIHRGGICSLFIQPKDSSQLEDLVKHLYAEHIDFVLVGHTSNLYIHNDVNINIVVSTRLCNRFEFRGTEIYCEAGTGVIKLSKECVENGVKGFEYLTGLPGTIAGALYNNSSCKQNSISDLLIDLRLVKDDGTVLILTYNDLNYQFRTSLLKEKKLTGIIISCRLKSEKADSSVLQKIASDNAEERKRILEGPNQNLGCTVNRCLINGPMPKRYSIPLSVFSKFLSFFDISPDMVKELKKKFLLNISGYSYLIPYISSKQMIIFIWKDEGADKVFPKYIEFMNKVFKTDKIEIEEITNG